MSDRVPESYYPLAWPVGYPRSPRRRRSRFSTDLIAAEAGLYRELERMDVTLETVVLSSNVPIQQRTGRLPIEKEPVDPGVAVYFARGSRRMVIACDAWESAADNVQAIRLTMEAMRGLDRWGASQILDRIFQGLQALPAPPGPAGGRSWWEVLELTPGASLMEAEERYRQLAMRWHPDRAGASQRETYHQRFVEIGEAINQVRRIHGRRSA